MHLLQQQQHFCNAEFSDDSHVTRLQLVLIAKLLYAIASIAREWLSNTRQDSKVKADAYPEAHSD